MNTRRTLVAAAVSGLALFGFAGAAQAQGEPLRVATDATFPPMEFVENGKRTGFDVELVEAIGKTLGRAAEFWTAVCAHAMSSPRPMPFLRP